MKRVELSYNPYFQETELKIDGKRYENHTSRIGEFLLGKPMDSWLEWKVISYQKWSGILPELMEYLNDDELEIVFSGAKDDFARFESQLPKQYGTIRERGFETGQYTIAFRESRRPEEVKKNIQDFIENRKKFVLTQKDMMDMEYLSKELEKLTPCAVDSLRGIVQRLLDVIDEIIRGCTDEKYKELWKIARREFLRICS